MIVVYFDDQCGLCSKEISIYKDADKSKKFFWQGLYDPTLNLDREEFNLVAALERLHVKDVDGKVHVGVDEFIVIWKHLPRWRIISKVASIRPLHWILSIGYGWFAKRRFRKLTHCQIALKKMRSLQEQGEATTININSHRP